MYDLKCFVNRVNLDSKEMNNHAILLLKKLNELSLYTINDIVNSHLKYSLNYTQYLWVCNLYYSYKNGDKK